MKEEGITQKPCHILLDTSNLVKDEFISEECVPLQNVEAKEILIPAESQYKQFLHKVFTFCFNFCLTTDFMFNDWRVS